MRSWRRIRPRFSLRHLFVLVSLMGIGFGWLESELESARCTERSLSALVDRHWAQCSYRLPPRWVTVWIPERYLDIVFLPDYVDFTQAELTAADLQVLSSFTTLRRIELGFSAVDDAGVEHLLNCRQLTYLGLERTRVTDRVVSRVWTLPDIEAVTLSRTAITDDAFADVSQASDLQLLELNDTVVTDATLKRLALLPELASLCVARTPISAQGATFLVRMPRLEELNLSGTAIDDEHFLRLADCQPLKELDVSETNLSLHGIEGFVRRRKANLKLFLGKRDDVTDEWIATIEQRHSHVELIRGYGGVIY